MPTVLGPQLLVNGDLRQSVPGQTVAGPGWTTEYAIAASSSSDNVLLVQVHGTDGGRRISIGPAVVDRRIIGWVDVPLVNGVTYLLAFRLLSANNNVRLRWRVGGVEVGPEYIGPSVNPLVFVYTHTGPTGPTLIEMISNSNVLAGNNVVITEFSVMSRYELDEVPPMRGTRQNRDCCLALPVCYESALPCGFVSQENVLPPAIQTPLLLSNTSGYILSGQFASTTPNAPAIVDGDLTGQSNAFIVFCGGGVVNFLNTITMQAALDQNANNRRMLGFGYWNGYGNDVSDGDGIGGLVLDLFAAGGANVEPALALPDANNGLFYSVMFAVPHSDVTMLQLRMGSKPFNGSTEAALREIAAIWEWEALARWQCRGTQITAVMRQSTPVGAIQLQSDPRGMRATVGGGLTITSNTLAQTGGPHTMTFGAGGQSFEGHILTNNPANFSSLIVTDENPVVTVTGNAANQFVIDWVAVAGARRMGILINGELRDAATNELVTGATVVPCE